MIGAPPVPRASEGVLLAAQSTLFNDRFNRSCFMFDHTLHESSLFDLASLVELAKRLPPGAYSSTGDVNVGDGWTRGTDPRTALPELIAGIRESNAVIMLKGLADDAEFGPVFRGVLNELHAHVGEALRSDVSVGRATLIISSPGRVTPYHIDAETNFLFQLRGRKTVNVFDPADRSILSHRELEQFYGGNVSAATYKADRQNEATQFDFLPGKGAHLPIHAPHWVRNGDSVSVSLSINCSLYSNGRLARLYRVNDFLRRRGLSPLPPGSSALQDGLKLAAAAGYDLARNVRKPR